MKQLTFNSRETKLVAQHKQKEFDRLKDYVLNQMSIIEVSLNPNSQSRNPYGMGWVITPSIKEIQELHESLLELRSNMLTVEERNALDE